MLRPRRPADTRPNRRFASNLNRRQLLALSSGALTLGVAGCLGDDDDDDDDTAAPGDDDDDTDDDDFDPEDYVFTYISWDEGNFFDRTYNQFSPEAHGNYLAHWRYAIQVDEMPPGETHWDGVVDHELSADGCTIETTYEEGFEWWDGTPVTAHDLKAEADIDAWIDHDGPENAPTTTEVEDDYTFIQHLPGPSNEVNVELVEHRIEVKEDWARPWLDQYEDASDEEAREDITNDLMETRVTREDQVEESLGNGLWIPEQIETTEILWRKWDDHYRADRTDLQYILEVDIPDAAAAEQAIRDGRIDMEEGPGMEWEYHDKLEHLLGRDHTGARRMHFNQNNDHFRHREVRQAIAFALDFTEMEETALAAEGFVGSHPVSRGTLSTFLMERHLEDDFMDQLIDYGDESKMDEAEERMQAAGYERDGDVWVGNDGETEDIQLVGPDAGAVQVMSENIGLQLDDFGLQTEQRFMPGDQFNQIWNESYDFDIIMNWQDPTHPHDSVHTWNGHGYLGVDSIFDVSEAPDIECGEVDEAPEIELTADQSERTGQLFRDEYPAEVGSLDLNGETKTTRPIEWFHELQYADVERTNEIMREVAWYTNWHVPTCVKMEEEWNFIGNTEDYILPDGSEDWHWAKRLKYLVINGHVDIRR